MTEVSLIICTRNRCTALEHALAAAAQAAARIAPVVEIDIVVVDNGSTDDTARVIDRMVSRHPRLMVGVNEARPGLSAARNAGLEHATGRILAFTDDDCELNPDYFVQLLEQFRDDEGPVVRGGRVELGDPRDLPITIKLSDAVEEFSADLMPGGFIHGCNMAASRTVFDRVGRFDERLGAGTRFFSGEDTDLLLRARTAGIPVIYVPDMTVRHFHGRRAHGELAKLTRQYEFGNGALLAKHGRAHPILVKAFYWNFKDALLELVGKRTTIVGETGVGRLGIFWQNLTGALRFAVAGGSLTSRSSAEARTPSGVLRQEVGT